MKPTKSFNSVIQQCQIHKKNFYVFYCNVKEKYHITRIINSKKRNI